MARTSDPNSATSQFFINAKDNAFLDFKNETPQGWGYTVFGKVIEGVDVMHAIEHTPTSDQGGAFANLPQDQVTIESISLRKAS
jgi:cyclophilin family peptidyl-prolyl cis-trans isomerase